MLKKVRKIKAIMALMFGIAGLALLIVYAGWMAALGVFLLLWGNNMALEVHR